MRKRNKQICRRTAGDRSPIVALLVFLICFVVVRVSAEKPMDENQSISISSPIDDDNGRNVCELASIGDQIFAADCNMNYLSRGYLCDSDRKISHTEVELIDRSIASAKHLYRYCACDGSQCGLERALVPPEAESKLRSQMEHYNQQHSHQSQPFEIGATRHGYTRPSPPPVILAISVHQQFIHPHTFEMMEKFLPCAASKLLKKNEKPPASIDVERLEDAYVQLADDRWRSKTCSPNLTVVMFSGAVVEYSANGQRLQSETRPKLIVRHTYTGELLASKIRTLVEELNGEESTLTAKLAKFLERFQTVYAENYGRRQHAVPPWALITFAVCSVLAIVAALIGNFVTSVDRKSSRKTKHARGNTLNRKWRAGFSGGMWAV